MYESSTSNNARNACGMNWIGNSYKNGRCKWTTVKFLWSFVRIQHLHSMHSKTFSTIVESKKKKKKCATRKTLWVVHNKPITRTTQIKLIWCEKEHRTDKKMERKKKVQITKTNIVRGHKRSYRIFVFHSSSCISFRFCAGFFFT